ncbi:MAG: hypothetical protein IPJ19_04280 [Planctomycetes bacterium]|nr:hypothetical protein [Planctomycetota bacterium]
MLPALYALAALLLLGLCAELAARFYLRRFGRYYVWEPHARTVMPLDPAVFPRGDALVRFEVNSAGERGAALPPDLARTYRVLVGGGSAAECFFLDQPSSWPEALGRSLSTPEHLARLARSSVHVGNVARSLTDCRALVEMFARILPHSPRADAIVIMAGASDLVRWLEEHTPATLSDKPLPTSYLFARHPEGPFGFTPATLALRRIAAALKRTLLRPIERRDTAGKRLAANRASRANATRILTSIADPAPMLAHYEQHLRELTRLLQRYTPRVVLIRQPWFEKSFSPEEASQLWMFGDGQPYRERVTDYYDRSVIFPIFRQIDAITERVARELQADSIELRSRIPADLEHYYDELHNTPKGCALVGELVAAALLATPAHDTRR